MAPLKPLQTFRCWRCEGTGFRSHEEGPAGATWTVRKQCWHCEGTGERYVQRREA